MNSFWWLQLGNKRELAPSGVGRQVGYAWSMHDAKETDRQKQEELRRSRASPSSSPARSAAPSTEPQPVPVPQPAVPHSAVPVPVSQPLLPGKLEMPSMNVP